MHNIVLTILPFLSAHFCGIKYIHMVLWTITITYKQNFF